MASETDDISSVIHCSFLREDEEHAFLMSDGGTEYQMQKSSVNSDNLPCTIHGKDDSGNPVLFVITSDKEVPCQEIIRETTVRWNESNTKLLLKWYPDLKRKVVNNILPSKRCMWVEMSKKFHEVGVPLTAEQVENRWKTLDRRYRKTVQQTAQKAYFPHFKEIDEIVHQFPSKTATKLFQGTNPDILDPEMDPGSDSSTSALLQGLVNVHSKRMPPMITSVSSKKSKAKSVARELALLRNSFAQRQARREALEEIKERERCKRHKEEMNIIREIINAVVRSKDKSREANAESVLVEL